MAKPKVIYYKILNFQPESVKLLEKHFDLVHLQSPDDDTPEILGSVDGLMPPLNFLYGRERIDTLNGVKVMGSNCTGAPHVDVEYARSQGIKVMYLREEKAFLKTITSTAELTWALVAAITRRVPAAFDAVCGGRWDRYDWPSPRMLSRMVLGIVGPGRLGSMVARYGKSFGMTVRYYTPSKVPPDVEGLERAESLEDLVSTCDVISLHSHLPVDGKCMFDAAMLAKFKPGSYLVNTARGPLIDGPALLEALEQGRLAGAGIDVHPNEFDPDFKENLGRDPLILYARKHDNLILVPHIGGCTLDSWGKTEQYIIRMMVDVFEGRR